MTFAIQTFLKKNQDVEEIVQRFSEPGHGVVQEVDAIHSKIERWLKHKEIFSPLSLIRLLVQKAKKDNTEIKVIQLQNKDFFDFQAPAKTLNYSLIPYTKVKEITLCSKELFRVRFRTSFSVEKPTEINLMCKETPRKKSALTKGASIATRSLPKRALNKNTQNKTTTTLEPQEPAIPAAPQELEIRVEPQEPEVPPEPRNPEIPAAKPIYQKPVMTMEKKKDIESMMKYMPQIDQEFYKALFGKLRK